MDLVTFNHLGSNKVLSSSAVAKWPRLIIKSRCIKVVNGLKLSQRLGVFLLYLTFNISCWLEVWAKPENLASLLAPHTVKSQKSEIFTFGKTVEIRLFDQMILKSFTYLINFYLIVAFKMFKSTKSSKAFKSRKSVFKPFKSILQQQLKRLNYKQHQILIFIEIIFSYYFNFCV